MWNPRVEAGATRRVRGAVESGGSGRTGRHLRFWLLLWLLGLQATAVLGQTVFYIGPTDPVPADCQTEVVFATIEDAVTSAVVSGTLELRVLHGFGQEADVDIDFDVLHHEIFELTIAGGYQGCSATPLGNLAIDLADAGRWLHVRNGIDESRILVVDGFVVSNGAHQSAGAILVDGAEVRLRNTILRSNEATDRGGAAVVQGGGRLMVEGGSSIESNQAGLQGGGVWLDLASQLVLRSASIKSNSAPTGGGVRAETDAVVTVAEASRLSANQALDGSGGGLSCFQCRVSFDRSIVSDNVASESGGGVHTDAAVSILVDNSAFVGNHAQLFGGALALDEGGAPPVVSGASFFDNSANQGASVFRYLGTNAVPLLLERVAVSDHGGVSLIESGNLDIVASLFHDNSTSRSPFQPLGTWRVHQTTVAETSSGDGAYFDRDLTRGDTGTKPLDLQNSILWNEFEPALDLVDSAALLIAVGDCVFTNLPGSAPGVNASGSDPRWVDAANRDYHLGPGSPAIDSCEATSLAPPLDIDSESTPFDDPFTANPPGRTFDAGADERIPPVPLFADGFESGNLAAWSLP